MVAGIISKHVCRPTSWLQNMQTIACSLLALSNNLVNTIAEPMGMFSLKTENIQEATVWVKGNNNSATTKITMLYNDLKIFQLKRENSNGKLKEKSITGFLANTFFIKNANPSGNQTPRTPEVIAKRRDTRSFFNFLWKAILTGIVKTIGIPKKFADQ